MCGDEEVWGIVEVWLGYPEDPTQHLMIIPRNMPADEVQLKMISAERCGFTSMRTVRK